MVRQAVEMKTFFLNENTFITGYFFYYDEKHFFSIFVVATSVVLGTHSFKTS